MDNKKLLKFVLKDLSELEELIAEKGSNNFDELEWEFLQTRVSGAKRMINILFDRVNSDEPETVAEVEIITPQKVEEQSQNEKKEEIIIEEKVEVVKEEIPEPVIEKAPEDAVEKTEMQIEDSEEKEVVAAASVNTGELGLDEEEVITEKKQTLGDSFSKEKSVNDLIDLDKTNLEQKLSNRPVTSIKSVIGINDRFQFIRELFNGESETFLKVVTELDNKKNIGEAVEYLQQNFKWKKNETSLKFVNLVKRRFSHD